MVGGGEEGGGGRRMQSSRINSMKDSLFSPRTMSTALQEDWKRRKGRKEKKGKVVNRIRE